MKVRNLRRLGGFILAVLLLPGLIALSSKSVQAQQRRVVIVRTYRPIYRPYWDPFWSPYGRFGRYSYYSQYVFRNSDEAFNEGYHDGLKTDRATRNIVVAMTRKDRIITRKPASVTSVKFIGRASCGDMQTALDRKDRQRRAIPLTKGRKPRRLVAAFFFELSSRPERS